MDGTPSRMCICLGHRRMLILGRRSGLPTGMLLIGDVSAAIMTHLQVVLLLGGQGYGGEGNLGSFVMATGY